MTFDKNKAEEWLDALSSGTDMRCPDGGWGVSDMLTLAGVCMMGVMTHGPIRYQLEKAQYDQLPSEHREASEETFEKDLFAAITFCANWRSPSETLSTTPSSSRWWRLLFTLMVMRRSFDQSPGSRNDPRRDKPFQPGQ